MDIGGQMPVINSKRKLKSVCRAVITLLIWFGFAQAQSAPEQTTITGKLADGTGYRVNKSESELRPGYTREDGSHFGRSGCAASRGTFDVLHR
jgi:hypothetical protein